jgi:hypothetical protein
MSCYRGSATFHFIQGGKLAIHFRIRPVKPVPHHFLVPVFASNHFHTLYRYFRSKQDYFSWLQHLKAVHLSGKPTSNFFSRGQFFLF